MELYQKPYLWARHCQRSVGVRILSQVRGRFGYGEVPRFVELDKVFHALDHSTTPAFTWYQRQLGSKKPCATKSCSQCRSLASKFLIHICKLGWNLASGACVATTLRKVPHWQLRNPEKHGENMNREIIRRGYTWMKTLPKAQRTRGLSSYYRISIKHQLQNFNQTSASQLNLKLKS